MQKVTEDKIREYVASQVDNMKTKKDLVDLVKYCVVNFALKDEDVINEIVPKLVEVKPFKVNYVEFENK